MTKIYKPVSEKYITSSSIYYTRGDQRIKLNELLDNLFTLLDNFYPVGCIYISVTNTNPGPIFGGMWERINDTFLLSAGDIYTAGTTGGEKEVTLRVENIPEHTHTEKLPSTWNFKFSKGSTNGYVSDCTTGAYAGTVYNSSHTTGSTGGGKPHNNMPPYLVVYMWKRTA